MGEAYMHFIDGLLDVRGLENGMKARGTHSASTLHINALCCMFFHLLFHTEAGLTCIWVSLSFNRRLFHYSARRRVLDALDHVKSKYIIPPLDASVAGRITSLDFTLRNSKHSIVGAYTYYAAHLPYMDSG